MKTIYHRGDIKLIEKKKNKYQLTVPWNAGIRDFWARFPFFPCHPCLFPAPKRQKDSKRKPGRKSKLVGRVLPKGLRQFDICPGDCTIVSLPSFLKTHKGKMSYEVAFNMLFDIANQIRALGNSNMGLPFLELESIIVVNSKFFFYIDAQQVRPIHEHMIAVETPHPRGKFQSPEFQDISRLPAKINYKSAYYSLAAIVVFCLTGKYGDSFKQYRELLGIISTTKLYWTLERLLQPVAEDRYYIII